VEGRAAQNPILAAGVTSASPALADLLRVVSELPEGGVVLPDLDLTLDDAVWDELGQAGHPDEPGGAPFGRSDAATHPQYHLKLLLNRMGVARGEVQLWQRSGPVSAPPERVRAISIFFCRLRPRRAGSICPSSAACQCPPDGKRPPRRGSPSHRAADA
jgi:ATP-dependent helicase/nuclease subunit B